ncbi:MAG: helix-hairpin-helix domain-containing protein [Gemmatimonadaceae bacterium]
MNPAKVNRKSLHAFTDLPNVGKAFAEDLRLLGFTAPAQLKGQDPMLLYDRLCELTRTRQDPCVLDTLMSITRFMDGGRARPWWDYTDERKQLMAARNTSRTA